MTINGPAPMVLAFFMNTAIDQACEKHILASGIEKSVRQKIESIYKEKNFRFLNTIHKFQKETTASDLCF